MTEEPHPAGDALTAYRKVLARAKRAEQTIRALRAENTALRAAQDHQEGTNASR